MSDDTTNNALFHKAADAHTDPAATRAPANPSEEEARSKEEARRTLAELLNRSLQARFAAVARQAVALALARFGAADFTHVCTGDHSHGFPEGSDYGALFPQDDLSPTQAGVIFQEAGQAVRTEAEHMKAGADPAAAAMITSVFIAAQLAEWQEGAAIEWEHLSELREKMIREDGETDAQKEAAEKEEEARKAAASGARYVAGYLRVEADNDTDPSWLAESIDAGVLIVCPRCHFLHLPARPFPLDAHDVKQYGPPLDACDVCALIPAAAELPFSYDSLRKVLAAAPGALPEARRARADLLFELWMGASLAADHWAMAEMEMALRRVEATVRED